ncbi:MAG: hypothetical protein A2Y38_11020 [Spirochaetes bacterium GWB1_59_5]|nr:MAG: hypothetical protein A2Y38_11020 [Spirochaetes bacterium GWB1_59_5]
MGQTFFALLLAQALWSLAVLLEIISSSLTLKVFYDDFQFLAVGLVAVLALSFSHRYEGSWFKGGWRTWWLFFIVPAATFLFAVSSPLHGLHRADASIDTAVPFGELLYTFSLPMLLLLVPIYFISLLGILRLFLHALHSRGARRRGALCAGAGLLLPLVGTVLTIARIRMHGRFESSSLWLVAGDLLIAIGLFRFRMAGVLPAARQKIVENLRDPVIVIDQEGLVVDHNDAFSRVMGSSFPQLNGRRANEIFSSRMSGCLDLLTHRSHETELTIDADGAEIYYSVRLFPVFRHENARIMVFRDITALKKAERTLRSLSVELEKKVEERILELEAEVKHRRKSEEWLTELNTEMVNTRKEIMMTLADVVENRGQETARHVARVSEYCRVLGKASGLSDHAVDLLANASSMHDIGKIGLPDSILNIQGGLSQEEVLIMRSHTRMGEEILRKSDDTLLVSASRIALEHHENWDGSGYPDGKKGLCISLDARIVSVCDVFDSLASARSYRRSWEIDDILEYFRMQRGRLFDPALVDLLFANLGRLFAIADKYSDEPEEDLDELLEDSPGTQCPH